LWPILRPPPLAAIAFEVSEVESSRAMAGGVMAANLPHFVRNWRRSASSLKAILSGSMAVLQSLPRKTAGVILHA
jgi:hypothetical protein